MFQPVKDPFTLYKSFTLHEIFILNRLTKTRLVIADSESFTLPLRICFRSSPGFYFINTTQTSVTEISFELFDPILSFA